METVGLRDDAEVIIRPVEPGDKALFAAGFERFGQESRYRRFMGMKKRLSERELAFFSEVDHHEHEALGAIDVVTGEGVGVARYIGMPGDPEAAEAALAIVDAWQHRGLGGALLSRLAARAREEGIRRFRAWMLSESRDMLRLFERLGPLRVIGRDGDSIEIEVELEAVETVSSRAASR
jgi:GNAT superfamily N-acetyltransferase